MSISRKGGSRRASVAGSRDTTACARSRRRSARRTSCVSESESDVPAGAKITLSVSKGPATTQVPDVTGMSQSAAESLLTGAGLTPSVVIDQVTDPAQDGIVQSTDPSIPLDRVPYFTKDLVRLLVVSAAMLVLLGVGSVTIPLIVK